MAKKYIEAEKLKAEIERLESEIKSQIAELGNFESNEIGLFNYLDLYDDILSFINSLQQEQPEIDLEKKIQDWCKENVTGVKPIYTADSLIYDLLPKTAHHFYELGKNSK